VWLLVRVKVVAVYYRHAFNEMRFSRSCCTHLASSSYNIIYKKGVAHYR